MKIVIYSTPHCPYCHMAKDYLDSRGLVFEEKNVAIDQEAAEEMVNKSGQMGVPVIDINGQIIVGFDRGAIDKLIK